MPARKPLTRGAEKKKKKPAKSPDTCSRCGAAATSPYICNACKVALTAEGQAKRVEADPALAHERREYNREWMKAWRAKRKDRPLKLSRAAKR